MWTSIGQCLLKIFQLGLVTLFVVGNFSLWGVPDVTALSFDSTKLREKLHVAYGQSGVQRFDAWVAHQAMNQSHQVSEQIQSVNHFWNTHIVGGEDTQIWKQAEYWATPLETLGVGRADCEDYVIGKYFSLLNLGVPVEKLRFIYVRARIGGIGSTQSIAHMVLGYYETPQSEPLVLDNLVSSMLPASQRNDLAPVFSFNAQGIYVAGAQPSSVSRISRWQELLEKMKKEGFVF
jgi:predicted transglutaminase-like cysteine proteinase